jgi:predicted NBD/HSP70 family sugar kinase
MLHRFVSSPEAVTFGAVLEAFKTGDEAVRELAAEIGQRLGIATANLVGVLGGCRILISGQVAGFGQFLLDAICEEIARRSLPLLAEKTEVGFVSLGTDIVLLGASALLLSHELGVF